MQQFLLTLLCILSVLSAFTAVVGWRIWPVFLIASLVMLVVSVIEFYLSQRRASKPKSFDLDVQVNTVPSPAEIEEQLARVLKMINEMRGTDPQPPHEISVECFECHVTEHYPVGNGNDAAKSPHLLTHPERCLVIGV